MTTQIASAAVVNVKYRLLYVEDWSRYEMYMIENGCYGKDEMLQQLCDYSIQRLYNYSDMRILNCNCYMHDYHYRLQSACLKVFRRGLSLDKLVRENDVIPLAPLKQYKGESWINHPLESFF